MLRGPPRHGATRRRGRRGGRSGGFLLAYAISVTRGLAVVDDLTYVRTFQAVNATVRTGWFAAYFFGSLPLLVVAAALVRGRGRWLLVGAAALYLVGVLGVTFVGNVPLNDGLAGQRASANADLGVVRAEFEAAWNRLNLVRTLAALAAFALAVGASGATSSRPGRRRVRVAGARRPPA